MAGGGINTDNISVFANMTETNISTTWHPVSSTNLSELESSQMDSDPTISTHDWDEYSHYSCHTKV